MKAYVWSGGVGVGRIHSVSVVYECPCTCVIEPLFSLVFVLVSVSVSGTVSVKWCVFSWPGREGTPQSPQGEVEAGADDDARGTALLASPFSLLDHTPECHDLLRGNPARLPRHST